MRFSIFTLACLLLACPTYAKPILTVSQDSKKLIVNANDRTFSISRSKSKLKLKPDQKRTINFPTHVIRLKLNYTGNASCDDIIHSIEHLLINNLRNKDITFAGDYGCYTSGDADRLEFSFDIYFDPQTDEAVHYLQQYIAKYNGSDFYGTPFKIEPAKGVIVWLDSDAGIQEYVEPFTFKVLDHMNSRHYFDSVYDVDDALTPDIVNKMFSRDPLLITEYIEQWMRTADAFEPIYVYLKKLSESNKLTVSPEFIFLMDDKPKAYSPNSHFGYEEDCTIFPSQKCLDL